MYACRCPWSFFGLRLFLFIGRSPPPLVNAHRIPPLSLMSFVTSLTLILAMSRFRYGSAGYLDNGQQSGWMPFLHHWASWWEPGAVCITYYTFFAEQSGLNRMIGSCISTQDFNTLFIPYDKDRIRSSIHDRKVLCESGSCLVGAMVLPSFMPGRTTPPLHFIAHALVFARLLCND